MDRARTIRWTLAVSLLATVVVAGPRIGGPGGPNEAQASGEAWTVVPDSSIAAKPSSDAVSFKNASAFTALRLDQPALEAALDGAPNEDTPVAGSNIISMPDPDGALRTFDVSEVAIYEPELAAELPGFAAYSGTATDGSGATIRFEVTPYGFHAQVIDGDRWWYIDPYFHNDTSLYISYFKGDLENIHPWNESPNWADEIVSEVADLGKLTGLGNIPGEFAKSGTSIRTFRIAMSTASEYSTFHGGTVGQVAAAITTLLNRVNGIYVRDVAVRFTLVGNNNSLVYLTDGACDPSFTAPNCDPHPPAGSGCNSACLGNNQTVVDTVIGDANYDIGHLLKTDCGLATTPSVGQSGSKARGCSGIPSPVNDPFVVDFVAHEIGHQFGANHTFNGTRSNCAGGTRNDATAYEPGSGTTIMAYAGICGLDDVQDSNASSATGSSDSHFLSESIDEILNWTTGGARSALCDVNAGFGNFCGNLGASPSGNTAPTANAGPDGAIPRGTPFRLNGGGSDANGDTLTFQWDQRDLGGAGRTLDNPEISVGPLFRAQPPSSAATRFLPKLTEVVAGNTNQNGACPALTAAQGPSQRCWSEFIPTIDRMMNFRVIVRDNNTTAGGLNDDNMVVNVSGNPFKVLAPNTNVAWTGGTQQTVTWDPQQTASPPVSAAAVTIRLSMDGGATFPYKLLENTPNDGSQQVTVPFVAAPSQGRIMVEEYIGPDECAPGVVFYDVSDVNFTLNPGGPPVAAPSQPTCWSQPTITTSDFFPVTPSRLIDTRGQPRGEESKVGSLDGSAGPLKFSVLGKGGVPASGVAAVSLNVTAVNGEQPTGSNGFVTVDGCASPRPDASNINFSSPAATPNAVITPVSASGDVCVYVFGIADILVDINGYFPTTSSFKAVTPARLADTRSTSKVGSLNGAAGPLVLNVLGKGGLPATGIGSVSLNVTAVNGEQPTGSNGFVTVDGCASPRPDASNINFTTNAATPNAVVTPVSSTGDICVYVFGLADILVDVNGYFPTTSSFKAITPSRLVDTRSTSKVGSLDGSAGPLMFNVFGKSGIPGSGVGAVTLNVTAVNGEQPTGSNGFVTVDGCATPRPDASNINFSTPAATPNAVITPVSSTGDVCVYVFGRSDILVDANGYFPQ